MDYRSMPFVKHCLTRPICFYHLENLVELEVQYVAIEEYIQMASRLSRLKKLFVSNNRLDVEDAYLQAMCLVKAIQLHHGKDTLQECHVWNDIWDEPPISKWLHLKLELLSLLPIPEALKDLNIEPLRPMDRYLATLHQMYVTSPQDGFLALAASHYPDLQARHILQRCRSLASLTIDDAASLGQDGDILAWAAQEALDRATGRPVPPAVPLVDLTLGTCALDVRVARRLIKGALVGFKGSLTSLDIEFSPRWSSLERSDTADSAMFSGWPVGNENQVSSQTQEAYFPGIEPDPFDVRLLEACPKLTNLIIILYACLEGSSSTYRQWPRLRLPSLESMMLEGLATVLFDPMSLTSMSRLNYLSLRLYSSNTFPDPTSWLKRWTWDWHLPTLTTLSIDCASVFAVVHPLNMKIAVLAIATCLLAQASAMTFRCVSAAGGYCRNCCQGNLGGNNNIQFGNIEGCTRDKKYCAHVTQNSNFSWKLWVRNVDVGCGCTFNMQEGWDKNGKSFWDSFGRNCC
ncbi:hypothetical protein BGZ73_000391 [Actinomortierella ambigua]|nr:hypothetical protein BGZ73_000391 [Actinomortierella ambigua]